jgi:hypothetical protein
MQFDPVHHHNPTLVIQEDGTSRLEWEQREVPQSLPDPRLLFPQQWRAVREQRDALMAKTDWRVVRATEMGEPLSQTWRDYRQALRDITLQDNPFELVWPQEPQEGMRGEDGQPIQEVL